MASPRAEFIPAIQATLDLAPPCRGAFLCGLGDRVLLSRACAPDAAEREFPVASVSKQFVAAAALVVFAQARLSLFTPLEALPVFSRLREDSQFSGDPESFARHSLHHLLCHTSPPPEAQPGLPPVYRYSNSGYALAGRIVEGIAGESLGDLLNRQLFQPAGMTSTRLPDTGPTAEFGAAGGIVSTGTDLLRWQAALYSEKLLGPEQLRAMLTPHAALRAFPEFDGFSSGHSGYGVQIFGNPAAPCYQHCGGIPGFQSKLSRLPRAGASIVCLLPEPDSGEESADVNPAIFRLSGQLVRQLL